MQIARIRPEFDKSSTTWRGKVYGVHVSFRADHILYSPQFHAFEARVITRGESDHYPVWAAFGKAAAATRP